MNRQWHDPSQSNASPRGQNIANSMSSISRECLMKAVPPPSLAEEIEPAYVGSPAQTYVNTSDYYNTKDDADHRELPPLPPRDYPGGTRAVSWPSYPSNPAMGTGRRPERSASNPSETGRRGRGANAPTSPGPLRRNGRGSICFHPGDLEKILYTSAQQARQENQSQATISRLLKTNCEIASLAFRGETPGDGDCFFHAISDQLLRLNLGRKSARDLRTEVTTFLLESASFQGAEGLIDLKMCVGCIWEDYCFKMAENGVHADHVTVIGMARMLKHDILILTSSPSGGLDSNITWVVGKNSFEGDPILLGHFWENHYQSLEPIKHHYQQFLAKGVSSEDVVCTREGHYVTASSWRVHISGL